MKFILLTQYYLPETGAPQNRLSSLAEQIAKKDFKVVVLTAMPNYPKMIIDPAYKWKIYVKDQMNGILIHRVWLFTKASTSKYIRLLNYLSFCFTSFFAGLFLFKKGDIVICESPPLFLGITAVILSKLKGAKLIFNVSDLWPESVEKVGLLTHQGTLKVLYKLEKWIYKKADLLSGQTQGIVSELQLHKDPDKVFWLRNGVDFSFMATTPIDNEWRSKNNYQRENFILLYGGVIGYAQALETIIETAKQLSNYPRIQFILVGDGPEKNRLEDLARAYALTNVRFIPNTPRHEMLSIVNACNASIIPLKKIDHFLGAIPSKIFEALAFKKPILLAVDGEAKVLFIEKGKAGLFVEPENSTHLTEQILTLYNNNDLCELLGLNGKEYVKENFDREKIAADFIKFVSLLIHA